MKRILLTLSLPFCFFIAYSQGDVPVDLFTGTPGVQIPLWSVTDHDLSESVGIYYSADGIKLEEQINVCGLGWELQGGGYISRVVHGLPDDYLGTSPDNRTGWLYNSTASNILSFSNASDTLVSTCTDENTGTSSDYAQLSAFNYNIDTEPDVYYYSIGEVSGSFIFDNTLTIRLMPFRDVKIEYTTVSATDKTIQSFTITTNNGVKYTLDQRETVKKTARMMPGITSVDFMKRDFQYYNASLPSIVYGSAWRISKKESPSGAKINYSYSSKPLTYNDTVTVGIRKLASSALVSKSIYTVEEINTRYSLHDVVSGTGEKIEIGMTDGVVTRIRAFDSRRGPLPFKTFSFTYKTTGIVSPNFARTFLASLTESGGVCTTLPPYKFTYIGVDLDNGICLMPSIYSNSKDLWGYYNAKANSGKFPKIYVYPSNPVSEQFRTSALSSYPGSQYVLDGADRSVDPLMIQTGSLQTVFYPTGGSATLDYEPHQYFDPIANQTITGGGLRIKSVSRYDGVNAQSSMVTYYNYALANGQSSGRLINKPVFTIPTKEYRDPEGSAVRTYATLAAGSAQTLWESLIVRSDQDISENNEGAIGYSHVVVSSPGAGSVEYDFALPGVYGQGVVGDWSSTTNKFARPASCPTMDILTGTGKWGFPYSPNPNFSYDRGFLLKRTEKTQGGVKVRETSFTPKYLYKTDSSVNKVWAISYEEYPYSTTPIYFFGKYYWLTDVVKVSSVESTSIYDANDQSKVITNSTQYLFESTAHKLPTKVVNTLADGTVQTNRVKYPLDFGVIPNNADTQLKAIATLQTNFRNSTPIERVSQVQLPGDVVKVVGASLVKFSDFGTTGKALPYQILSLKSDVGLASFVDASSTLQGANYVLTNDSHYDVDKTFLSFDVYDIPLASTSKDRRTSSTRLGFNKSFPVVQSANAAYNEFAFSDFETDALTNLTGNEFQLSKNVFGAGRTGLKSIHPSVLLSKTIQKANVANYVISFWLKKASSAVDFRLNLKNVSTGTVFSTVNFTITPVGSGFEYFETIIPVTAVSQSTFVAELQGLNFTGTYVSSLSLLPVIDDVAFYPQGTDLIHYTYDIPFGPSSVTDATNTTTFYTYDSLGRQKYVWDQDMNLIKRNTFNYAATQTTMTASISGPASSAQLGPITFTSNWDCVDGVTYEWDFGEGAGYQVLGSSASHTFQTAGVKTISLRKSHPAYPTVTASTTLKIVLTSFSTTICEKGASIYSTTAGAVQSVTCSSITDTPTSDERPLFRASGSGTLEQIKAYNWFIYDDFSNSWKVGPSGQQVDIGIFNSAVVHGDIHFFKIRCDLTTVSNRKGTSNEITIYVSN